MKLKSNLDRTSFRHKRYNTDGVIYGYSFAHSWIYKNYGKAHKCENSVCKKKSHTYQWSNISHQYQLNRNDWQQLCRSCHAKYDTTDQMRDNGRKLLLGNTIRRKPVKQLNRDGSLVAVYPSVHHASRATGILKTAIYNCLGGLTKSSGGYIWQA